MPLMEDGIISIGFGWLICCFNWINVWTLILCLVNRWKKVKNLLPIVSVSSTIANSDLDNCIFQNYKESMRLNCIFRMSNEKSRPWTIASNAMQELIVFLNDGFIFGKKNFKLPWHFLSSECFESEMRPGRFKKASNWRQSCVAVSPLRSWRTPTETGSAATTGRRRVRRRRRQRMILRRRPVQRNLKKSTH